MTTGEKLQKLRKENNFTQEDLADILSVSRQTIYNWESNNVYPETEKIIAIAKLYKCSVEYLLMDEVDTPNHVQEVKENSVSVASPKKQRNSVITAFSIAIVSVCTLLFGLFFAPAYSFDEVVIQDTTLGIVFNYYEYAFKIVDTKLAIWGIFSIVLLAANLGLGIANIVVNKKGICTANKFLNVAILFLAVIPCLLFGNYINVLPCTYVVIGILVALLICQATIKPLIYTDKKDNTYNNRISFSTFITYACIVLIALLSIPVFNINNYFVYVFNNKDWYIILFGIINILCILANLGVNIANTYYDKDTLSKVSKYLTFSMCLLTLMPFLNGDVTSKESAILIFYEIIMMLFLTFIALYQFKMIRNSSNNIKKSDTFGMCFSHTNALIILTVLTIIDYTSLAFDINNGTTHYSIHNYSEFYYILIEYAFIVGAGLCIVSTYYENRILSIIQRVFNILVLSFIGIWTIVVIATHPSARLYPQLYIILILLIALVALQYVFKNKMSKKV